MLNWLIVGDVKRGLYTVGIFCDLSRPMIGSFEYGTVLYLLPSVIYHNIDPNPSPNFKVLENTNICRVIIGEGVCEKRCSFQDQIVSRESGRVVRIVLSNEATRIKLNDLIG